MKAIKVLLQLLPEWIFVMTTTKTKTCMIVRRPGKVVGAPATPFGVASGHVLKVKSVVDHITRTHQMHKKRVTDVNDVEVLVSTR
jgi:hypothetical protein|tara:strand:+ start:133 stop:387 length:255 start_codon:yes stop_codon:yes gene_type:complete